MLERCIQLEPLFTAAYLELVKLYGGQPAAAGRLLARVVRLNPYNADLRRQYGDWLMEQSTCKLFIPVRSVPHPPRSFVICSSRSTAVDPIFIDGIFSSISLCCVLWCGWDKIDCISTRPKPPIPSRSGLAPSLAFLCFFYSFASVSKFCLLFFVAFSYSLSLSSSLHLFTMRQTCCWKRSNNTRKGSK